ncbi:MAG: hypothetical protein MRJ93_09500 [Nitrososphaeraceae archaeon]|nr:hypothetical protein [Nitrososphaeraceae archaeon]
MTKIDFSFSGGYANIKGSFKEDLKKLPNNISKEISELLESSKIFDPDFKLKKTSFFPPDIFSYTLIISKEGEKKELSFNDVMIPETLQPLIARLRELALDEKYRRKK